MNWLFAVLSAVLLVLCFPPYNQAWLAPFALAPLLVACMREVRAGRRFLLGYVAGVIYWFGVCNWIQYTLASHGGVGEAGGWALFALFCLAKAMQLGVFAWLAGLAWRWRAGPAFVAALWVAIEYTHAPLGFAWLMLGNAAIDFELPLRLAPVTGVWGISFLFALTAAALACALLKRPRELGWLVLWPLLFALPALPAKRAPVESAVLVQPNVDEDATYTAASFHQLCEKLAAMSLGPVLGRTDRPLLVVWPEVPAPLMEGEANFTELERQVTTAGHTWLLTGLLGHAEGNSVYNSAALFDTNGHETSRYDKVHLVPFGEYVPWPFGAITHKVSSEVSDFAAGGGIAVPQLNGHGIATFICYESVFPGFIRDSVRAGAQVLFNPSNDGWFGKTAARFQHIQIVRMRAVENARWILRATNNGVTAAIDPAGRLAQTAEGYTEVSTRMGFDFRRDLTLYARAGDWFVWLCITAAAFGIWRGVQIQRHVLRAH